MLPLLIIISSFIIHLLGIVPPLLTLTVAICANIAITYSQYNNIEGIQNFVNSIYNSVNDNYFKPDTFLNLILLGNMLGELVTLVMLLIMTTTTILPISSLYVMVFVIAVSTFKISLHLIVRNRLKVKLNQ